MIALAEFRLELYLSRWEFTAEYNTAASDADSMHAVRTPRFRDLPIVKSLINSCSVMPRPSEPPICASQSHLSMSSENPRTSDRVTDCRDPRECIAVKMPSSAPSSTGSKNRPILIVNYASMTGWRGRVEQVAPQAFQRERESPLQTRCRSRGMSH